MQAPGIQPPPQFSFPGPPSPQLPARSQSVRVPKNLRNLCLVISEKGHQGPERGRDLPEVTQQIRILSQGAVPSSFNRRDPPLPYLGLGVGRPQGPRRRDKVWAGSVPACLSHWSAALGTPPPNAGHVSSGDGDVSRAGNWAGPRKSPSGRQIPTGLEASGEGDSLPDSSVPSPLCPPSVLPEEKRRPREGWALARVTW